jgi:hypothetical protein
VDAIAVSLAVAVDWGAAPEDEDVRVGELHPATIKATLAKVTTVPTSLSLILSPRAGSSSA